MAPGPIGPTPSRPGRRHRDFSPSQLRLYRSCPERYYRRYISRERMPDEFSRALLRSSAVHKVLARVFTARRDGEADPAIRPLAEAFLPRHRYAKAAALDDWLGDVAHVEQLVANGLSKIATDARVIQV
ncbi:MAG: PD-(D/E)XK nuclease family protein [Thermomicrobiales bacterium]|nr:PD-(D/E)XK nuclease family protein [Thermomicrobiales bacterium]